MWLHIWLINSVWVKHLQASRLVTPVAVPWTEYITNVTVQQCQPHDLTFIKINVHYIIQNGNKNAINFYAIKLHSDISIKQVYESLLLSSYPQLVQILNWYKSSIGTNPQLVQILNYPQLVQILNWYNWQSLLIVLQTLLSSAVFFKSVIVILLC